LLEHQGFPQLAGRIVDAVRADVAESAGDRDSRKTSEIGEAIRALLA